MRIEDLTAGIIAYIDNHTKRARVESSNHTELRLVLEHALPRVATHNIPFSGQ